MFENKIAVVTGGACGIGQAIAEEFRRQGATVRVIDKAEGPHFVGDISDKDTLEAFASQVIRDCGHVDYLVNNALPLMKGIDSCTWKEFQYALAVGVTAPFYLTKLFAPHFAEGADGELHGGERRNLRADPRAGGQPRGESSRKFHFSRLD